MDEAVTRMKTLLLPVGLALAASVLAASAGASPSTQALQDPTRPPDNMVAGSAAGGSSAGPQLQTILIGRAPGGRHLAVIDGETVRPGDSFRGARVARIAENEVELVRGRERQVLRLTAQDETSGMTPARAGLQR
jgi:MSHA biogenesis protein MshK